MSNLEPIEIVIQIIHKKKGMVCMIMDYIDFQVGDIYTHLTHATEFNKKIESDLKDGEYRVIARQWLYHLGNIRAATLQIFIE